MLGFESAAKGRVRRSWSGIIDGRMGVGFLHEGLCNSKLSFTEQMHGYGSIYQVGILSKTASIRALGNLATQFLVRR